MINMKYAFEKGGPKRLEIVWDYKLTKILIKLDGKEIASFNDPAPLREGQELPIDDGSFLKIQLTGRSKLVPFEVTRNGQLLPSNLPPPAERLKSTCQLLYIITAMNIMGGLSSYMPSSRIKCVVQNGWLLAVAGLIVLILALFVKRKSKIALTIVTSVFALDTIAFLFYTSFPMWMRSLIFILRLILLLTMLTGFSAINELKWAENTGDQKA